jgi:superfamily I DNA and/or RNA helicase
LCESRVLARGSATEDGSALSVGVVTPHSAQRGALATALPEPVTANTVEKYQGGERDIIAVSGTVSGPAFARREEEFILNPRRLLVAISRSRLLTIVVCSTALFEVVPEDSDRLDDGPVWTRLFTQAVGRDPEPAWAGSLGEFRPAASAEHADVPVRVYPSTIDVGGQ